MMAAELALLGGGLLLAVVGAFGGGLVWSAVGIAFVALALLLQGRRRV